MNSEIYVGDLAVYCTFAWEEMSLGMGSLFPYFLGSCPMIYSLPSRIVLLSFSIGSIAWF
jgi:hypothetical protein